MWVITWDLYSYDFVCIWMPQTESRVSSKCICRNLVLALWKDAQWSSGLEVQLLFFHLISSSMTRCCGSDGVRTSSFLDERCRGTVENLMPAENNLWTCLGLSHSVHRKTTPAQGKEKMKLRRACTILHLQPGNFQFDCAFDDVITDIFASVSWIECN